MVNMRICAEFVMVLFCFKDGRNIEEVMRHIKKLEDAQKATADSSLEEIRHFLKFAVFFRTRPEQIVLHVISCKDNQCVLKGVH